MYERVPKSMVIKRSTIGDSRLCQTPYIHITTCYRLGPRDQIMLLGLKTYHTTWTTFSRYWVQIILTWNTVISEVWPRRYNTLYYFLFATGWDLTPESHDQSDHCACARAQAPHVISLLSFKIIYCPKHIPIRVLHALARAQAHTF